MTERSAGNDGVDPGHHVRRPLAESAGPLENIHTTGRADRMGTETEIDQQVIDGQWSR